MTMSKKPARKTGRDVPVGDTVDAAAWASGDTTRNRETRPTVKDSQPYLAQLREQALADALTTDPPLSPSRRLAQTGSSWP